MPFGPNAVAIRLSSSGCAAAFPRREAPEVCVSLSLKQEGAGNAGCALHPRSRVRNCAKSCTRAYRAAENTRPSLRNGFTAYGEISPENGSFASVASRETVAFGCIDASTATSGPHAFAVRFSTDRHRHFRVHRSPPLVVTMANAPLSGTGCSRYIADLGPASSEILKIRNMIWVLRRRDQLRRRSEAD